MSLSVKTKNVLFTALLLALAMPPLLVAASEKDKEHPARALIQRVLPEHADQFVIETLPAVDDKDVFEIESRNEKIVLRGNNGVSIASALNWYLKYTCQCQITWCGTQLDLPTSLPAVKEKIRRVTPYTYRYAFNHCTFGYSMAFWDWERWEREIDFMALNGINAPLAATGAEVVCRNVYRDLGLPESEIDRFIAGPPYLPWFLMNNLDGWGGPNPASWYDRQEALQKRIVAREMELGMKPIFPAFSGHVPPALKQKFPDTKITPMHSWGGFPKVHLLDPADPLFHDLGGRFVRESTRLYGTAHLYAADLFNEMRPPTTDPAYLKKVARTVYDSIADVDSEAVWFMQGWLFLFDSFWSQPRIEAFLSDVPDDRMVIIDLFSDAKPQWMKTNAYAGKRWLWCIVHNWGGKQGMYGRLSPVGIELPKLLGNPAAGRLAGIGTLNEGIDVNPIVFDQFYEMAWRNLPMDVSDWVHDYVRRRYGQDNPNAQKAWAILADQLYSCKDKRHGPQGNFLAMPPSLSASGGAFARATIFYNTAQIREAFRLLLEAADELGHQDTYRFDLADLGRQVLSDLAQQQLHARLRSALKAGNATAFDEAAAAYYDALRDCDQLLRTHTMFQLGRYLQYPRGAGATDTESAQWESNARRLITLWGNSGSPLSGYAQRQYGGLMGDFNLDCWRLYLGSASEALHAHRKFDAGAADRAVRAFTEKWIHQRDEYPVQAEGDTVAVARKILEKYCPGTQHGQDAESGAFVGRWEYEVGGKNYVREFSEDGSVHLYVDGVKDTGWTACTWSFKDGEVSCRKPDGTVFATHRLQDPQTLVFIKEAWGPATRAIDHHE